MSYNQNIASTTNYGAVKVGTGITVSDGIISANGTPSPSLNYGFFYSTATQPNPVANAINTLTWNTTGTNNQVFRNGGNTVTVTNAGTYTKVFTVSLQKINPGSPALASIWLRYNGTDVLYSNQEIAVPNQTALLFVTGGYTLDMAANSVLSMHWSCNDTGVQLVALPAQVGPVRPEIPSAKITLTRIS